jgi:hypothetical protein
LAAAWRADGAVTDKRSGRHFPDWSGDGRWVPVTHGHKAGYALHAGLCWYQIASRGADSLGDKGSRSRSSRANPARPLAPGGRLSTEA